MRTRLNTPLNDRCSLTGHTNIGQQRSDSLAEIVDIQNEIIDTRLIIVIPHRKTEDARPSGRDGAEMLSDLTAHDSRVDMLPRIAEIDDDEGRHITLDESSQVKRGIRRNHIKLSPEGFLAQSAIMPGIQKPGKPLKHREMREHLVRSQKSDKPGTSDAPIMPALGITCRFRGSLSRG